VISGELSGHAHVDLTLSFLVNVHGPLLRFGGAGLVVRRRDARYCIASEDKIACPPLAGIGTCCFASMS
jgi:hypothetical protein